MKIYIMTDLEGCAGVIDRKNWVLPESRYYEDAKLLLTNEINAAVRGLYEAGASEILIADGHGYGGVNHLKLDNRVKFLRGCPGPWPFGLEKSYDCVCFVGQHAKSSTPYSHISHTGSHLVIDRLINSVSIGEFGNMVFCARELCVAAIFLSGDKAAAIEAEDLVSNIVTASIKQGLNPDAGRDLSFDEKIKAHDSAIHLHPDKACELIETNAKKALLRYKEEGNVFTIEKPIEKPYEIITHYRHSSDNRAYITRISDPDSIIKMLNSKEVIISNDNK